MLNKKINARIVFAVAFIFCATMSSAAGPETIKIEPPGLGIGAFFAGEDITLSGSLPADGDIIVEVIGPQENAKFNIKGRVGPFWMNRAKVELQNAPFLYVLLLPAGEKWKLQLPSLGLGMQHLKQEIRIGSESIDQEIIFEQFIKLKHAEHLYVEKKNAIHYGTQTREGKSFTTAFHFPSSTAPGKYRIAATMLQADRIVTRSVHSFEVEEVGVIKSIHELAYHRELIYGIVCVMIALAVGALMGLFFGRTAAH